MSLKEDPRKRLDGFRAFLKKKRTRGDPGAFVETAVAFEIFLDRDGPLTQEDFRSYILNLQGGPLSDEMKETGRKALRAYYFYLEQTGLVAPSPAGKEPPPEEGVPGEARPEPPPFDEPDGKGGEDPAEAIEEAEKADKTEKVEKNDEAPVSDQEQEIECPKCGQVQPRSEECVKCGVIFEKYFRQQARVEQSPLSFDGPEPPPLDPEHRPSEDSFLPILIVCALIPLAMLIAVKWLENVNKRLRLERARLTLEVKKKKETYEDVMEGRVVAYRCGDIGPGLPRITLRSPSLIKPTPAGAEPLRLELYSDSRYHTSLVPEMIRIDIDRVVEEPGNPSGREAVLTNEILLNERRGKKQLPKCAPKHTGAPIHSFDFSVEDHLKEPGEYLMDLDVNGWLSGRMALQCWRAYKRVFIKCRGVRLLMEAPDLYKKKEEEAESALSYAVARLKSVKRNEFASLWGRRFLLLALIVYVPSIYFYFRRRAEGREWIE